jgi:hypothetical protein
MDFVSRHFIDCLAASRRDTRSARGRELAQP